MTNCFDPVHLTQELIKCASITPKDDGVMDVCEKFLKAQGFNVQRIISGTGDWVIKNLFATISSGEGSHLAIAGHLDVVPSGDLSLWKHDPFAAIIENGRLFGRGSVDMKSGLACAMCAASQLVKDGFSGTISFLITGDEEEGTEHGTRAILNWCSANGIKFDACLVAEPTGFDYLGQAFNIGRRGSLNIKLTSYGEQGHAACPDDFLNPITPLVDMLSFLKNTPLDKGSENFPPSNLEVTSIDVGNVPHNVIPAKAEAKFNVRYNCLHTKDSLLQKVHEARDKFFKNPDNLNIFVNDCSEPFICENKNLIDCMKSAIKSTLGVSPDASTGGGTTDGRFINKYCPIIEFGVPSNEMHKINEAVSLEDIRKLTDVYYHFYKNFFMQ